MFEANNEDTINLDFVTDTNKIFASTKLETSPFNNGTNTETSLPIYSPVDDTLIGTFDFKIGKDKIKSKKQPIISKSSMNRSKSNNNMLTVTLNNNNQSSPERQGSNISKNSDSTKTFPNQVNRHHMSSFTFSDPLSQFPGAGQYNLESTISNDVSHKIKHPSYTFGTMHNFPKL